MCDEEFGNMRAFKVHRSEVHPDGEIANCHGCGKTFKTKSEYEKHALEPVSEDCIVRCDWAECKVPFMSDTEKL